MLISEKSTVSKTAEVERERARGMTDQTISDDIPPAYGDHLQDVTTANASSDPLARLKGTPTNFLSVDQRNGAIKGTYIIDPSLHIHESYLPPPVKEGEGETTAERKNLYLHTMNGSVDVDVWLVGRKNGASKTEQKRTTLDISSNDGSITAKLHAIDTIDPFTMNVFTKDGRVTVLLPRSFHGPITMMSGDGSCTLSSDMLKTSIHVGLANRTTRYFVGDYSSSAQQVPWEGDEVKIETRDGKVRVRYIDEVVQPSTSSSWCIFSRLFHC
ncbi:hypothetical protein V8B97DRAFT_821901 [Scleroderma yunnanense]